MHLEIFQKWLIFYEIDNQIVKFPFPLETVKKLRAKFFISLITILFIGFSIHANGTGEKTTKPPQDSPESQTENYSGESSNEVVDDDFVTNTVEDDEEIQPTESTEPQKESESTINNISKYNFIFYFIYKYKYENRTDLEELDEF